jgi:hypothetical protein
MIRSLCAALVLLAATSAAAKPPSWDRKIEGAKRFKVLKAFDGEAVLDQETGLVWERAPTAGPRTFANATLHCLFGSTPGDRHGWRLPRIEELVSLLEPPGFSLPSGSPFELGKGSTFWSATTVAGDAGPNSTQAWAVVVPGGFAPGEKSDSAAPWCVRGGESVDGL